VHVSGNGTEIRGIIFDLDGVIADSHPVHEIAWKAVLAEAGRAVSSADIAFIREGRTRAEMLVHFFPQGSPEELTALGQRKDELYYGNIDRLRPVPGVLDLIQKLAQASFPLALATSASRERVVQTLSAFGISPFFRVIVTGSDVRTGKPDPAMFLQAARELQIDPSKALVVEDSISGVMAAKTAGMKCVVYSPEGCDERLLALEPEYVIQSFAADSVFQLLNIPYPTHTTARELYV
jgi:HAD superfamily hydrolase (TIGR01509 family)